MSVTLLCILHDIDEVNNNRINSKYRQMAFRSVQVYLPLSILGGITIWNPWSKESDANLECCYSSQLKFMYSEKATKSCEISALLLTTVHKVKSKV